MLNVYCSWMKLSSSRNGRNPSFLPGTFKVRICISLFVNIFCGKATISRLSENETLPPAYVKYITTVNFLSSGDPYVPVFCTRRWMMTDDSECINKRE